MSRVYPKFSDEDSDLRAIRWHSNKGYARNDSRYKHPQISISKLSHRIVLFRKYGILPKRSEGLICDHMNGDRLDNRRENIRLATFSTNTLNSTRNTGSIWRDKYAERRGRTSIWRANYRGKAIGYFKTREDAQKAIDAIADPEPKIGRNQSKELV